MSQEIINVMDYICDKLGIAIDWTAENVWPQVMELLGRYRLYSIVKDIMWIVVSIVLIITFVLAIKAIIKGVDKANKTNTENFFADVWIQRDASLSIGSTMILIWGGVIAVAAAICMVHNANDLMKWAIIPEIQILELLQGYVK